MNVLSDLSAILTNLCIPFEAGHYGGVPPDEYVVIIPLADSFELSADNMPQVDVQEARLAIYTKGNFYPLRNQITDTLLMEGFTVTDRCYIGFEPETEYHHAAIDVAREYKVG